MHDHAGHGAHAHAHGGGGWSRREQRRRLQWALALAATYLVAEVIGGLWTGSLALLADAGHMASDVAALALSSFAFWLAERPASAQRTFGWRRFEILAALANGTALVVVAVFIVVEAIERVGNPQPVLGLPMLAIAAGGLVVNLAGMWIVSGGRDESLNLRGAWLHLVSDAVGSIGAMTAGFLVWAFGWHAADAVASIAIAALITFAAFHLLRDTVNVLLEAAPTHLDIDELRRALLEVEGTVGVHDLHVWTITSGMVSLSCHVHAAADRPHPLLLKELQQVLRERFQISHVTIQIEPEGFEEHVEVC